MAITGRDWEGLSEVWGPPFWSEVKACEEQPSVQIRKPLEAPGIWPYAWYGPTLSPNHTSSALRSVPSCCCEHSAREGDDHSRRWAWIEGIFCSKKWRRKGMGDLWCHCTAVPAHHRVTARGSCWRKPDKTIGSKKKWLKMLYQI